MAAVLSLDFDGVLHPADNAIFVDFSRPVWQLSIQLRTQGCFVWLDHLRDALEGTDTRILVHSTWRRRLADSSLRELLGPEVGPRLIITDYWIAPQERSELSHPDYICRALDAWQTYEGEHVDALCVIDDRPEFFSNAEGLSKSRSPFYIWANGNAGISEASVQQALSSWAKAHGQT